MKGGFQNKILSRPLASFVEVGRFGCFETSIMMLDKIEEYGIILIMAWYEESENSWFELIIVKKNLSTFSFERILFDLQDCVEN